MARRKAQRLIKMPDGKTVERNAKTEKLAEEQLAKLRAAEKAAADKKQSNEEK